MSEIEFLKLDQVDQPKLMNVLNQDALRTHLIDHSYFNVETLQQWVADKVEVNSIPGCRVRGVCVDGEIAGWCGIQPDDNGFEIAIVISQEFWGLGTSIFKTLMSWARELGHNEIVFHLLATRREYKALAKMATKVHRTQLLGSEFTTYHLSVS